MSSPSATASTSASSEADNDPIEHVQVQKRGPKRSILWRLYLSHTLSTWNARTFEFGAVIFLAAIFPGTLFYASCYALFRSAAAALLSSWIGGVVDRKERLYVVRMSIVYQRYAVAASCLVLLVLLRGPESVLVTIGWFIICVLLACIEKLAFVGNTVAVERDWVIVVSDSLGLPREELNSTMRRIDLVCKLVAPLCISLVDGYSTRAALWVVFGQNALSVIFEYFAIAQVFTAVPELAQGKGEHRPALFELENRRDPESSSPEPPSSGFSSRMHNILRPWKSYVLNPAFLASFSLALLYLTVLSFASQMTTYLLTLGYTSIHASVMRLVAVIVELSATCAAPALMRRIGAVRSGLWFINEQLLSAALAIALFTTLGSQTKLAGGALVVGVILSRLGLWGFDLCVQYLVQEDAPEATRGSFSAVEASLQNLFELVSFAATMVFAKPEQFKYPVYISAGAIAMSAICYAGFVRQKRGHLLHTSKCFRRQGRDKYQVLPTIEEEEEELQELPSGAR
ncbi:hypothetical protein BU26DRAFT_521181 [Trematosphaeria pertusa]|uniref:Solute carrier family 40 member n=1 Tax=Trematosphaeria pertusa TaxID=390896 RepID=A0A6A6I963_9PLEO|nr:uncharacterized protein BU26DRAFT_521181 [Trematosphaeria pertusa]KAF2246749.1 hypothetical protein BU26DRAFT_521181 [Trematosphaeria pertusa]